MSLIDERVLDSVVTAASDALDADTARMFGAAMRRTLTDAVSRYDDGPAGTAFLLTGDIPAMWLRDSAAQMRPYLAMLPLDPGLGDVIAAVVREQSRQILRDPYANAFNDGPTGAGHQGDATAMTPWTWERKYEVDSLTFPLQLAHQLWRATGRTDHLDEEFARAARLAVATIRTEQDHDARSDYTFERTDCPQSDTLVGGRGTPVAVTGLTWSGFRPSDDACQYHYNIPGNLFAVAALRDLAELTDAVLDDAELGAQARALADELEQAVEQHGLVDIPEVGRVWAYEVDGLGNHLLMDDANMPSLLSLPLTGGVALDDPRYRATRAFVLSGANPTYVTGTAAEGLGSPHTPPGYVWPIAAAVQGLTTTDVHEKRAVLAMLRDTHAARGRMTESFDANDPARFTREWFSWADAMFCELVLDVIGHRVPQGAGSA
ncbi:glycoside hydrolase family 125 protein [Pseudactinotalea sp.]|uniref:glycoside hydrolase family 125 protein n=1 Tax=Pseudactinotalea sp. TaxID=1926260 RepID=UPI003B3A1524